MTVNSCVSDVARTRFPKVEVARKEGKMKVLMTDPLLVGESSLDE